MPNTFTIEGTLKDTQNAVMAGVYVKFRILSAGTDAEDNTVYPKGTVEFLTDASGDFTGTLWINGDSGRSAVYEIELPTQREKINVIIPSSVAATTVRLEDVINIYETTSSPQATSALATATAYTDAFAADASANASFNKAAWLVDLNVEDGADVTDATNVTAAGAVMDSEVSSLSGIKTLTVPDSTTISTFGATLVDDLSAAAARTSLGLGTIATQAAGAVAITGGTVAGITDITVEDGGTGASTAADARTNLGVAIGTDVQAWDNDLDDIAAITHTDRALLQSDGTDWTKITESDLATPNRAAHKMFMAGSTASYLSIPDDPTVDVGAGDFSVFWWGKLPSTNNTVDQMILRKVSGTDGFSVYYQGGTNYGQITTYVGGDSFNGMLAGADDDKWHFFCLTFDRDTQITLYKDGVLTDTAAISAATDESTSTVLSILGSDLAVSGANLAHFANYVGLTKDLITASEVTLLAKDPQEALNLDNLAALVEVPAKNQFYDRSPNAATVSLSGSIDYAGYPEIPPTTLVATTAYTALITDSVILVDDDTAAATVTITLPAAATAGDGFTLTVKKLGTTADVIIDADLTETIDEELTQTINLHSDWRTLICDGTNWHIIG